MNRGGKIIGTAAMLSVAACGGQQGKLEIRPIKAPLAAGSKAVPFRIAEARGQLALGNVALALEAFRMALREDPESIDAMAGVGACYDQMARFDLSRRNYEAALAIAPGNTQVLTALAGSLDMQGRAIEAASVRQEVKDRIALAAQDSAPPPVPATVLATAPAPIVPVGPAIRPVPAPQFAAASQPIPTPAVPTVPARVVQVAAIAKITPVIPAAKPAIGRSVTVILPPARPMAAAPMPVSTAKPSTAVAMVPAQVERATLQPVAAVETAAKSSPSNKVTQPLPAAIPVQVAVESAVIKARVERDMAKLNERVTSGPRIERLSLREVELVTATAPQWHALTVGRTQRSATVRFIPLRQAALRPAGVRVLNAARVDRLAARTRIYLADRGWRAVSIGDAPAVRMRSIILYPANRRRVAERLSVQFGFAIAQRAGARQVTILLGRDAARDSALRART
ncbi:LytR C-terminal domain-containing protein [Sphingomonas sp.]|uniref:LytR C-terminal domain-containing protein n=1 Tax=Sphingomonas sp. TaxID=28214 RepID=UPI00286C8F2A|nr:LytR C-terminal domain-containing protein [Sphingomonas sp.]